MLEQEIEDNYKKVLLQEFHENPEPPKSFLGNFYNESSWDETTDCITDEEYQKIKEMHLAKRSSIIQRQCGRR